VTAEREWLVAATRRLASAVGRTEVDPATMADLALRLETLTPAVEERVAVGVPRVAFADAVGAAEYSWQAFNPALPALLMRFVDGVAYAELPVGLDHLYEGPPGLVHGGVSAMLMDTMLSSAVQHHGHRAVTASLTTDYRRPARLGEPLHLTGRVEEVAARKIFASGELRCGGEVCVEARGLFVRIAEPGA
jgi:uncharacterized protein (TIGR00369 family)